MSILIAPPAKFGDQIEIFDSHEKPLLTGTFEKYEDTETGAIYTTKEQGVCPVDSPHIVRINGKKAYMVRRNQLWDLVQGNIKPKP